MEQKYKDINEQIENVLEWLDRPWLPRAVLMFSGILVLLLHIPLAILPMGRDQGIWATAGMALNHGRVFFKTWLDFNFPGEAYLYQIALAFTDDPMIATVLISAVGSLLIVITGYLLLKDTVSRGAAAWAVLLFAIQWPTAIGYWDIGQKDFMTAPFIFLATWLALRSGTVARYRRWLLAGSGLSVGLAFALKPVIAIAGPLIAVGLTLQFAFQRRREERPLPAWSQLIWDLCALLAGGVLVVITGIIYFWMQDALHDAYISIFKVAYQYGKMYSNGIYDMLRALYAHSALLGEGNFGIAPLLLMLGCCALIFQSNRLKRLWLLIPLISTAFSFIIQRKAYPYHALPWKVTLFLVAGIGIAWIWQRRTRNDTAPWQSLIFGIGLFVIAAVCLLFGQSLFTGKYARVTVPVWRGTMPRSEYLANYFIDDGYYANPAISEHLAQHLKENTTPEDLIFVWGMECQLYALSGRMYATDAAFDYMLTAKAVDIAAPEWLAEKRRDFISQLRLQRPVYLIVATRDTSKMEPVPSDQAIKLVPGFQEFIDDNYVLEKTVERFKVYRLKT